MNRKLVANKKRLAKKAKLGFRGFPVGSLTYYGPDDSRASKLVAGASCPTAAVLVSEPSRPTTDRGSPRTDILGRSARRNRCLPRAGSR